MSEGRGTRVPKQRRSIERKRRIIEAAKALYRESGYHGTTTNEIARRAQVSIGTLYAYFEDKEEILLEVLRQLDVRFFATFDFADAQDDILLFRDDARGWLRGMIEGLVGIQETQRELYREIVSLRHTVPGVAAALDEQEARMRRSTLALLGRYRDHVTCADIGASAVVVADFAGALVELVAFKDSAVDRQRLIDAGVEALYRMLRG